MSRCKACDKKVDGRLHLDDQYCGECTQIINTTAGKIFTLGDLYEILEIDDSTVVSEHMSLEDQQWE